MVKPVKIEKMHNRVKTKKLETKNPSKDVPVIKS